MRHIEKNKKREVDQMREPRWGKKRKGGRAISEMVM
jgi:hypothetical protein